MLKNTSSDPNAVTLSTAAYRLLLAFYPTCFRRAYGPHMAQVFRDCCLKTYHQSGPPGMLALWALTLFDWFKTVIEEQFHRGTDMTQIKLIRLSGWGMILGAVTMVLASLVDPLTIRAGLSRLLGYPRTLGEYNAYRTFSEEAGGWLILLAALLLFSGTLGLRMRYGQPTGRLGSHSLLVSMSGGGTLLLASLFGQLVVWDGWWSVRLLGMVFLFGGLAIFGFAALQTKPMPRWNGLPILAGIWFPLFLLISLGIDLATPGDSWWELPDALMNGMLLVTVISLILLGYVLQGDEPGEETVPNPNPL